MDVRKRSSVSSTRFHFPPQPVVLAARKHKDSGDVEYVSLKTLIESRCPSLFTAYRPTWWLFNGHLQSLHNVYGNFSKTNRVGYRRQLIRLIDGGTIGLDFSPEDSSQMADDTPIVVVQTGLTGGSHEPYVRAILAPACTPVQNGGLGYRAVVVTFRGCAGVPVTSPRLYTAGHTDDLRQALIYISNKYPRAPLLGLGFSLGANIMTRYLGEEGDRSRLSSALVVSCPWDMEKNGYSLVRTFLGRNLWARGMGWSLYGLVKRHKQALSADPNHPVAKALPSTLALRHPRMHEFDAAFTKDVGDTEPPFPFPTVAEYYRWASSDRSIKDIKVPFMAINSADDPVVTSSPIDGGGNPNVVMVLTRHGGHIGWFSTGIDRWTTKPVIEWLGLMGKEVIHETRTTSTWL